MAMVPEGEGAAFLDVAEESLRLVFAVAAMVEHGEGTEPEAQDYPVAGGDPAAFFDNGDVLPWRQQPLQCPGAAVPGEELRGRRLGEQGTVREPAGLARGGR